MVHLPEVHNNQIGEPGKGKKDIGRLVMQKVSGQGHSFGTKQGQRGCLLTNESGPIKERLSCCSKWRRPSSSSLPFMSRSGASFV
jgi:hypothetical protein